MNHERVLTAFGYWPSSHDADVVEYRHHDNEVELALHAFEMTSEVDERGYFRLTKHHRIDFRFADISNTELDRFREMTGNTLDQLVFSETGDGQFTVMLDSVIDGEFYGSFRARFGEVVAIRPYSTDGRVDS